MKIEPTREWSESRIEKEGATEIGAGVPPMETEIIRVTITRSEETEVFLRVPKGWRPDRNSNVIRLAALDVDDCEWSKDGWQENIEIQGWKSNAEKDSKGYTVFDATGGKS